MKAVGVQGSADRLLDVLVRHPVLAREHFDGIADEKVEQDHKRIKFHQPPLVPNPASPRRKFRKGRAHPRLDVGGRIREKVGADRGFR